jgi:hypothetical protein
MYSYKNEWTRDDVGGQGRRGRCIHMSARGALPLGMASDFLPCRTSDQEYYRFLFLWLKAKNSGEVFSLQTHLIGHRVMLL